MRVGMFLYLYGLLLVGGVFLIAFFGRLTWMRSKRIEHPWYTDRYLVITLAVTLMAVGNMLQFAARLASNAYYGQTPILFRIEAIPIALGLVAVALSSGLFVFLADLESDPNDWKWLRRGALIAAIWAALTFVLVQFVPLEGQFPTTLL